MGFWVLTLHPEMAKVDYISTIKDAQRMIEDARAGKFAPVYLLMGTEPYFIDQVADAIAAYAVPEEYRDFALNVCYGADFKSADAIVNLARSYPMLGEKNVIIVKDAQQISNFEEGFGVYFQDPCDFTILVVCLRGKSADKRKALYKTAAKSAEVLESNQVEQYQAAEEISYFLKSKGYGIAPDAAELFAEHAGVDMAKVALETEKILKNLPEGATQITVKAIEENVGISREFSVFELTKLLSVKDAKGAIRIARGIAQAPKFALPVATAALFNHYLRILKYHAVKKSNPMAGASQVAPLLGVNPYFLREYDAALRNYSLAQTMGALHLIKEYDFLGKGGDGQVNDPEQLMTDLVVKLLSI